MLKNSLAALPGTLEEKMAPYTFPIIQNMEVCQGKEQTDKLSSKVVLRTQKLNLLPNFMFLASWRLGGKNLIRFYGASDASIWMAASNER